MSTAATHRPTPADSTSADALRWGAVHLDVIDLEASTQFYGGLLGLQVLGRDDDVVRLGVEDAELVVLHGGATQRPLRGHSGLFHFAIHLPSEAEFARVLARLFQRRHPNAPTDHVMHWATYLDDPNGINVELSFETLDRFTGELVTAPLDLDQVFRHLPEGDPERPLPAQARIGHLHMHVPDMAAARERYAELGFTPHFDVGSFADMTAGGTFPHRLAYNIWAGVGATPQPSGAAGLRYAELTVPSGETIEFA
jgi:catechol 2,3-dioxygenase